MKAKFEEYDPKKHATDSLHGFEGDHVVVKPVPLSQIEEFEDEHAYSSKFIKDPNDCPQLDSLEAVPRTPPIQAREKQQMLHVPCEEKVAIHYPQSAMFSSACRKRIEALGLKLDEVTDEILVSGEIGCPLDCITGFVKGGVLKCIEEPCFIIAKNPKDESEKHVAVRTISEIELNEQLFPKEKAAEVHGKSKATKTHESIRLTPIKERSINDHLIWCIFEAQRDVPSNAVNAIRNMALNLTKHPEFTEESLEYALCTSFMLKTLGKSDEQRTEMASDFLNGFGVMEDFQ